MHEATGHGDWYAHRVPMLVMFLAWGFLTFQILGHLVGRFIDAPGIIDTGRAVNGAESVLFMLLASGGIATTMMTFKRPFWKWPVGIVMAYTLWVWVSAFLVTALESAILLFLVWSALTLGYGYLLWRAPARLA